MVEPFGQRARWLLLARCRGVRGPMPAVVEDPTRHGTSPSPCEIGYRTESAHRRHGAPGDAGVV